MYENFETTDLLRAVVMVDCLREDLSDGGNYRPPKLRINLLKLHQLAMAVVNNDSRSQTREMFDLAIELASQATDMTVRLIKSRRRWRTC